MKMSLRDRRALRPFAALTWAVFAFLLTAGSALAGPIPANLGAGLYDLVISRTGVARVQQQLVGEEMLTNSNDDMLRDDADRVLVDIVVDGRSSYDAVRAAVDSVPGVAITAEDPKYRAGIIEGFVPVESLIVLAKTPGVSAIHAVRKPTTNVGSTTRRGSSSTASISCRPTSTVRELRSASSPTRTTRRGISSPPVDAEHP